MSKETELEIQRSLGSVESKLDDLIHEVRKANETTGARLNNHGERLGSVERWRFAIAGGAAASAVLVGALWQFLITK